MSGGESAGARICAHALQQIRAIDGGRTHAHADFAARGLGRGPLDERKNFGPAGLRDRDGSHGEPRCTIEPCE